VRALASVGTLHGLKNYDAVVRGTQFSIQVDLVTEEVIDAGSVQDALLRALATTEFGIKGWSMVRAKVVVTK
jgi:hypothetical protein